MNNIHLIQCEHAGSWLESITDIRTIAFPNSFGLNTSYSALISHNTASLCKIPFIYNEKYIKTSKLIQPLAYEIAFYKY